MYRGNARGEVFTMDGILGSPNKDAQYLDVVLVVALTFVLVGLVGFHAL